MLILALALQLATAAPLPVAERVAFLSGKPYALCLMQTDGTELRELVPGEDQLLHFDCGPRGIAYVSDPRDIEDFRLFVLNPGDGTQQSVDKGIRFYPEWSPDGDRLAFMNHSGRWKIKVTEPADWNAVQELSPPAKTRFADGFSVNDGAPGWSPDGKFVAFQSNRTEKSLDIFSVELETGRLQQITKGMRATHPRYSPDSQWILFRSLGDLYLIRPDGTGQRALAPHAAADSSASWFPDSQRVLFVSERFGNPEVCVVQLADDRVTNLTRNPASEGDPALSPDGRRILFVSDRDGNAGGSENDEGDEIYVMDVAGENVQRLTRNAVRDADPAWLVAPDGR